MVGKIEIYTAIFSQKFGIYNNNNGDFVIHYLRKRFGTWYYYWI